MEKYGFEKKLKEAVLIKKDSKTTAMVQDGEVMEICCPGLCSRNVSENGSPCLVLENEIPSGEKYTVAAFSLDSPNRENKGWICLKPAIFEEAVQFFLNNGQMEEMAGGCKAVHGKPNNGMAGSGFVAGDAYIELNVPDAILDAAGGGWVQIKSLFLTPEKIEKYKNIIFGVRGRRKKMIFLTVFQHGLNDRMQSFFCKELGRFFGMDMDEKTEFWVADLKLEPDGITLVSCQNITESVLLE